MPALRECNYVNPPSSVRWLAQFAGIKGIISLRELMILLGSRQVGPVPFYALGHNTNTINGVIAAINRGANAVEVDVTAYSSHPDQLCVDHPGISGNEPADDDAPPLDDFLDGLRTVAKNYPGLSLIVLDCKPPAATPRHGRTILDSVRSHLTTETSVNVIISVADFDGTSLFDDIASDIGPREGLMIDGTDRPDEVASFLGGKGVTRNCYGNGTSFFLSDEGAMVYRIPIERACWMMVTRNEPRFVYAWTVNDIGDQKLYMRVGVNGIISDLGGISQFPALLQEPEFAARFRLAIRSDNPFLPPNSAYGLTVRTSDIAMAGTEANVQFTLIGNNGSSSVTVNTAYNGRMERNSVNYVVLPSQDLGALQSISVQRDDSGNPPDWHLASIAVQSYRFGGDLRATFDCWIDTTEKFTRSLT